MPSGTVRDSNPEPPALPAGRLSDRPTALPCGTGCHASASPVRTCHDVRPAGLHDGIPRPP